MDDFDDPIDDLLSDGDSFFEDPKLLAKKSTPKKNIKAAADVFGFGTDIKTDTTKEQSIFKDDDTFLTKEPTKSTDQKIIKTESKLPFGKDDVNNLLGFDTVEPKSTASKKSSILSEILGDTKQEDKSFSTFDDILQSSSFRKKETSNPVPVPEIKTPTQTDFTTGLSREPRRARRNSPNIIDPLGIFESQKKDTKVDIKSKDDVENRVLDGSRRRENKETTETTKRPILKSAGLSNSLQTPELKTSDNIGSTSKSDLPGWLGGSEVKLKSDQPKEPQDTVKVTEEPMKKEVHFEKPKVQDVVETSDKYSMPVPEQMLDTLLTQQKISSSHIELQNASLALQQQESQLMIAVQLKKYEDNLAEMQRKQQEMLLKQDVQFNTLLERQFAKQHTMENNMRLQQERINNHIQLLLSQPSAPATPYSEEQQTKNEYIKNTFEEHRKFYDDIINSLKQKHQEEIFLLEESYKKQLSFLESSLESTEMRLKTEIDSINKHFTSKIEELSTEKQNIITKYEEKIKLIHEENISEIKTIQENCKITIADVRNEYKQMLDDMSENKIKAETGLTEVAVVNRKIDDSLKVLDSSTRVIQELQTKMSDEHNILNEVKSETLNAKEMEIKMMQSSLEKQRATSDNERAQLLTLVKTLEIRLAEQTQAAREERWTLQQATATLAARSLAFDREMEFAKTNLEREREHIKVLKETMLAEQEEMILKLTEEKLAIAAEKSRIEVSAKLNQNFDSTKAKAEIEAAIKIAKEATELTDKERENLCKQQCEIEMLKRSYMDRETKLSAKQLELEKLFKVADEKYREGERSLTEAKVLEHKYTEQLKDIQKQLASLAAREKKLTEEKIIVSKNRLSVHNQMNDVKKCSLCEAGNFKTSYNPEYRPPPGYVEHDAPWGTDAEIMRFKYDLENDHEVSREISVAENS